MSKWAHDKATIQEALAEIYGQTSKEIPPEPHFVRWKARKWRPKLNPIQQEVYECQANYILAYGPRASGKTIGALHKLVEHCYLNQNALAILIVGVKRQAEEGGAWFKLTNLVLPQWESGLGFDPGQGEFYTEPKTNTAKDIFIWMRNIMGGWSRILLLSMPVVGFVADRVKGLEPSFVLVDEAQTLENDTYFSAVVQQLGRRPGITSKQQIVYCANPEGPSHWLWKRFFQIPIDVETGVWDHKYAKFNVLVAENMQNLPKGYWENVLEAVKGDEIEKSRMVDGEWIDRPEGAALFKDIYDERTVLRGDAIKNKGILPLKGHQLILGYDLGAAHSSIHFKQYIPTTDRGVVKIGIDEINTVGDYIPYTEIVPRIIERMRYWETEVGCQFSYRHISDSSAFNMYRAKDGSFDAWDVEEIARNYVRLKGYEERFIIKLEECPKGLHSVEARIKGLKDDLMEGRVVLSAVCMKTRAMFLKLEESKDDAMKPRRSQYVHPFDSWTYPDFFFKVGRGRGTVGVVEEKVKPEIYSVGGG